MLEYLLANPLVLLLILLLGPTGATAVVHSLGMRRLDERLDERFAYLHDEIKKLHGSMAEINKSLVILQRELHRLDMRLTVVETLTAGVRQTGTNG